MSNLSLNNLRSLTALRHVLTSVLILYAVVPSVVSNIRYIRFSIHPLRHLLTDSRTHVSYLSPFERLSVCLFFPVSLHRNVTARFVDPLGSSSSPPPPPYTLTPDRPRRIPNSAWAKDTGRGTCATEFRKAEEEGHSAAEKTEGTRCTS